MAGVKLLFRAARAPYYSGAEVSLFVQKFRQSKTLGFGYSSRQGAKTPSSELLSFRPLGEIFLRSLVFPRIAPLAFFAANSSAACGFAARVNLG